MAKDRTVTMLKTLPLCAALLLGASFPALAQDDPLVSAPTADGGAAPMTAAAPITPAPVMPAPTPAAAPAAAKTAPSVMASIPKKSDKPKVYRAGRLDAQTGNEADSDGIAATVNDISVSDYEVRQRLALYVATAGFSPSADDLKRIRGQMIEQLQNEKLQLQEAIKKHITVAPGEVDGQIQRMADDNHLTHDQLREALANAGASEAALRAQLTAQIAWQKTVQFQYSDRINVTPEDVAAELTRYAEGADKPHYLLGEIFIAVDNPDQDAKVKKDAEGVESQLRTGAPFQTIARQFSQSPSAASGGDMGWVHQGQIATELDAELSKMKPGGISAPIRSVGGYYILLLHARQDPLGTKIVNAPTGPTGPDGTLKLARLILPIGNNPTQEEQNKGLKIASQIRANYSGCEMLAGMPKQIRGAVYAELGDMKLADLNPDIQKLLAATQPGTAATPFVSAAGVEIIGRCDKKVEVQTAYTMPTKDQVEEQLFQQQISVLARRYMRDLKRDADVEIR